MRRFHGFSILGLQHSVQAAVMLGLGWHAMMLVRVSFLQASGRDGTKKVLQIRGFLP
jgi:hypothetical protein